MFTDNFLAVKNTYPYQIALPTLLTLNLQGKTTTPSN